MSFLCLKKLKLVVVIVLRARSLICFQTNKDAGCKGYTNWSSFIFA
jgi:hypothetical protein